MFSTFSARANPAEAPDPFGHLEPYDSGRAYPLTARAEAVLRNFEQDPSVDAEHADNLRTVIESSGMLRRALNSVIDNGSVKSITPLADQSVDGVYDPEERTIGIGTDTLEAEEFDAKHTLFVLAHETMHAADQSLENMSNQQFKTDMEDIRRSHQRFHDYTEIVSDCIQTTRVAEGRAQLAGWNTLVEKVREECVNAGVELTPKQIYLSCPSQMDKFIEVDLTHGMRAEAYALKPSFNVNSRLGLDLTPSNTEAAARYHADVKTTPPYGMGQGLSADYAHMTAAHSINEILRLGNYAQAQKTSPDAPIVTLNTRRLGLSLLRLHEAGIDPGGGTKAVAFIDTSTPSGEMRYFKHTMGDLSQIHQPAQGRYSRQATAANKVGEVKLVPRKQPKSTTGQQT